MLLIVNFFFNLVIIIKNYIFIIKKNQVGVIIIWDKNPVVLK